MAKGYLIGSPLQTKLAAESSLVHRHNHEANCGGHLPNMLKRLLTMNSVARHGVTD
jgi:hypothetical protein